MPSFFGYFPKIYYNGKVVRNTVLKVQFFKDIVNNYSSFYPYTITDLDTPETIADMYYGDVKYVWLVYLSMGLIDPYYDWPLPAPQFADYLTQKYGDIPTAQTTIIQYQYNWSVDPTDIEQVYRSKYIMQSSTYNLLSNVDKSYWKPVYAVQYENDINESKREIRLLDSTLVTQVESELSKIF